MCAGRFGFQKEMNALRSLRTGSAGEGGNVTALLRSTHEVEMRVQVCRALPQHVFNTYGHTCMCCAAEVWGSRSPPVCRHYQVSEQVTGGLAT